MSAAAFANTAWLASSLPASLRFYRALEEPENTQQAVLQSLIDRNVDCAFGRAHNFGAIRGTKEFRKRVPVMNGDELAPWVARLMRGESAVLTSEPVIRLLPTSGSTGGRKLIPFTATFQRELNAAIGPWMMDLCRRQPSIALGEEVRMKKRIVACFEPAPRTVEGIELLPWKVLLDRLWAGEIA